MGSSTLRPPFIERADVARGLASAVPAQLVFGEPGIGKTRLLHEWLRVATTGAARIAVTIHEASARDTYDVLHEIVRALAHGIADRDAGAAYLRTVRDVLASASASTPLCIAIDDIWRADPTTLGALVYLVDRLQDSPIRWLFTSRNDREVARAFARLVRAGLVRTTEVPPLARAEVDLLARSIDPTLDETRLAQLYARSGGNALFVELLAWGDDAWTAATLRAAVAERLRDLHAPTPLIALYIATGTRVTIERLAVATGMSPRLVRAACDDLCEAAILVADGETLRFRHDLIAEATIADASEGALRDAYDAWLALAGDARERMRCFEGAGRWPEFVDCAIDAGWNDVEDRNLDGPAAALASRVLEIVAIDDPRRALALALRARVHVERGRLDEARRDFAAFSSARDGVEPVAFAATYGRFAIAAAPDFGSVGLSMLDDLYAWSEREAPGTAPTLAHARMLVRYCAGDVAGAHEIVRAGRDAPAMPRERLRRDLWDAYLGVQLDPAAGPRAATQLADAVRRADAIDAPGEGARACFMRAFIAQRDDEVVEAERWCRRGLAFREPKPRSVVAALRMQLCEYLFLRGDAWEALRILIDAYDERQLLRRDARETIVALLAFAQALTGSFEAARATIATADDSAVAPVVVHAIATIRGWIVEMTDDDATLATRAYEDVIERATVAETSLAYAYLGRARIALAAGDGAALARLGESAREREARAPKSFRVATLVASFAALEAGDPTALRIAATEAATGRSAFDDAFTHLVLGERTGDGECLRRAADTFARIGTLPLADRARAAARRSGLRLAIARNGARALSERARTVGIGIAAGKTNAEIAADLHLSARTVEKYVSSLLAHFDVRSRVDIATIVLRGEIDAPRA